MFVWLDIREANLSIRDQNARSENRKEICPRSENKQDIRICYNMKYRYAIRNIYHIFCIFRLDQDKTPVTTFD